MKWFRIIFLIDSNFKFFYFTKAISWTTGCHRYGAIGMCWFYILKNKFEIHVIYFNDNLYPHIS